MGDPGRFRQVITNLVGNSVKFTERGHIFVKVQLAEQSMASTNIKSETHVNGNLDDGALYNKCQFETLSGFEAADNQNSWDTFKHLIANEEFRSNTANNLTVTNESSDLVTVMISVEDTGIGIPLSAQGRVFMPFMQADSSTSRNYGGTGIGLSISKCLVELMGGQINFVSRPQVGSTFSFTANFGKCDKKPTVDIKKSNLEELPSVHRGLKAVVVDGKPVRAAVTKYHLKRLGILVEVASSVKMAAALWGKNGSVRSGNIIQPDVILLEKDSVITNEECGSSLLHQLEWKQNGHTFKFPKLILLATNIKAPEFDKAKEAGFSDTVIMKPLRASMIGACLQQVLGTGKKREHGKDMVNGSSFLQGLLCGKKILVVDDNMVNRRVAAGALKKFGADVECAESGKAALALLQLPHGFDACFMDIQMPEMDGFEATRRIRLMERNENELPRRESAAKENARKDEWHVPILAMTADVIHATYEECQKCGMDGYVSKPFEEENLYQAVAKFFK